MKVTAKAALAVALGATAAYGVLNVGSAEAAILSNIEFNYTFSNDVPLGRPDTSPSEYVIEGTGIGEVDDTTGEVSGLTNVVAQLLDGEDNVLSTLSLSGNVDPILTLSGFGGTPNVLLDFVGVNAEATAQINSFGILTNNFVAEANVLNYGVLDKSFGDYSASATPVPTPALLPGLMLMGGAIRRRLQKQEEAA